VEFSLYTIKRGNMGNNNNIGKINLKSRVYYSPLGLVLIIGLSVFLAEAFIMFLLSLIHPISIQTWAFLDAALLVLILAPILYFFGFRPLISHINERKKAEETTQLAYAELRQVFHTAADGIRLIDGNHNILRVNETFATMSGFSKEEAKGKKCYEVFPGPQCHTERCSLKRIMNGEERIEFEAERISKDGRGIPCIVTATPFRSPGGEFIGIVEDFKDITIRKKAETALKRSEEKLNAMLSSINDYMIMIDKGFNIIWANDVSKDTFGKNIIGEKCFSVFFERAECCENQPCFVAQVFSDSKPHENEMEITTKEGKTLYFHCTANVALKDKEGNPSGVLVISRDITESKRLERQLLQAQKMEAVGQLAGGIAHDFNNILTAIVGYGHLLQTELGEHSNQEINDYVDYILKSAKRAANLTHALLAFSRTQIINTKPVNINDIIIVLEKLLIRLIGEDIELITNLYKDELIVMADTTQIEQVLMNLATNARDAMPDGGTLIIKTSSANIDEEFSSTYGFGRTGNYAVISVEDTGEGMDEKTKERIFDPFFTTKEVGKGTGLGLAMVYGIVKQHDGFINVYSELGKGTTFKIYLPLIESKIQQEHQIEQLKIKGGNETIFIIEDDFHVRDLTRKILERAGYIVLEAADGQEAVKIFNEQLNNIDLVILDVIMPRKNGKEVYEELKKLKPEIKVLFTSGYTSDIIHRKGIIKENQNFILKPVSPQALLATVRSVLNKGLKELKHGK
jgi:PAS domain S-box-containing protein